VLFLASRCFPWDICFMCLQSDAPDNSLRAEVALAAAAAGSLGLSVNPAPY
jgi:hypothetical protein